MTTPGNAEAEGQAEAMTGIARPTRQDRSMRDDQVTVIELDLVDRTRPTPALGAVGGAAHRRLVTTIHLPPPGRPAPLIVLAHGFNGHPRKFTALARHWADAGYVVAVPRFPITNDEAATADTADDVARRLADLGGQAGDISFVVDAVLAAGVDPSSPLADRLDSRRIGVYGLSLGAMTVWTATLGDGDVDERVGALVQSDGTFPGDADLLADVRFPVFVAHSDVDAIFDIEVVRSQFALLRAPRYLLVLHGAAHAAVGENTPTPADRAYRDATTVFWHRHLGGAETPFPASVVEDGVTTFVEVR